MNKTAIIITLIITLGAVAIVAMLTFGGRISELGFTLPGIFKTNEKAANQPSSEKIPGTQQASDSKNTGVKTIHGPARMEVSGMLTFKSGLYILIAPNQPFLIRNSGNPKLAAILELYLGKETWLGGTTHPYFPQEITVLSVNGKEILTAETALDTAPLEAEIPGESFADFYERLSA